MITVGMFGCTLLSAGPFPTDAHSLPIDIYFGTARSLADWIPLDDDSQAFCDVRRKAYSYQPGSLVREGEAFSDPDTLNRREAIYCDEEGQVFNNQGTRLFPIGFAGDGWSIYWVSSDRCIAVNGLAEAKHGCLQDQWFIGNDGDEFPVNLYPPTYITEQGEKIYCDWKFRVINGSGIRLFPIGHYIGTNKPVYEAGEKEYFFLGDLKGVGVDRGEVKFFEN
ncbi:MAG: hypothetical protein LBJ78_02250 [Puniceicoccales bacterium]|jgi:hypothetical protein|nr:hypothetical protein [Puniceicoccales bacterium]